MFAPAVPELHIVLATGAVAGVQPLLKLRIAPQVEDRSVQTIALVPSTLVSMLTPCIGRTLRQSPPGAPVPAASSRHAQNVPICTL
jgi:hypothetical protein